MIFFALLFAPQSLVNPRISCRNHLFSRVWGRPPPRPWPRRPEAPAAERRLKVTPFCAEKRENAHFPFAFSSFCLEPKGKVVQLLEIYPAVQKVRSGSVGHQGAISPPGNDRYTGLSAPLAVTPRRPPEIYGSFAVASHF